MEFLNLLEQKREVVLGKWIDYVLRTYPKDSTEFLAKQKDRFHNPVGHSIKEALELIYGQILAGMETAGLDDALDGIIRIRSVQEFTPSQAVAFVFRLKVIVREALRDQAGVSPGEFFEIDSRIDRVALLAFDKYMECREKLHEIRVKEIKNVSNRLLTRVQKKPDDS